MVFVRLPAGRFVMGSPADERFRESQELQHEVVISRPFHLGKYEVTQGQWARIMTTRPSWFDGRGDDLPVENVTWFEVRTFVERLTAGSPDSIFRLPTEAEWEYACRAGSPAPYSTGATLTPADARIDPRPPLALAPAVREAGGPLKVGSFPANAWGLHDMHGNVWEWTADRSCPYQPATATDPRGRCDSDLMVIRGGSWYFRTDSARCGVRYTHHPRDRGFSLGFRVVRQPRG